MRRPWYLATVTVAVALAGCATPGPLSTDPPVAMGTAFDTKADGPRPDRWWRALDDPGLDRLVRRALADNPGLKAAAARLRAARSVAERESAGLFPAVDITAEGTARDGSAEGDTDTVEAGLAAEYEADLWGRVRAGVAAERLRAEASRVRLAEARSRAGAIHRAELLRRERLLAATRAERATAEEAIATLEHQLAVLLAQPPQDGMAVPAGELPALPPVPDPGPPAALVRRRPDVRAAHLELRAADRDTAAAVADQFPRLTLSASLLTTDAGPADLYSDWASAFTGRLVAPLIDAGRREAEVARSRAVADQRLYAYGETILTAFREVADALAAEHHQRERVARLDEQVRLARREHRALRRQFTAGAVSYRDVLAALADAQSLRRERLSARLALVEDRIALYRALAGGFDPEEGSDDSA